MEKTISGAIATILGVIAYSNAKAAVSGA